MQAKRVLFVSYGAGHIAIVLPIIRALYKRNPGIHIDLLALTTAGHEARRQGFKPLGYKDFSHWYDASSLLRHAGRLLDQTRHPLIEEEETIAYLGINMEDLSQQIGPDAATERYAQLGRWAFYPLRFMTRLLQSLQPDVVVATNSPRSEQAAIEAASILGIPSVCVVDLFSPPGDPFLERSLYADKLTTISDLGKKNLVATGVSPENIHVTGSPAFDSLFFKIHQQHAQEDRLSLGWEGLHVILWAGHLEMLPPGMDQIDNPAEFPSRAEQVLRDYVAGREDTALIIRYHPNHVGHFNADRSQARVLWSDPAERHAHRDIHLSEIVVIQATTVGLEAAIAGKSVISLDHSPSRFVFPCSEQGVSRGVCSFEELPAALDAAIDQPFVSVLARQNADSADQVACVVEKAISAGGFGKRIAL